MQSQPTVRHTRKQKRELAAEVAALFAFSAIKNNDKVGLLAFSEQVEKFVPPRKGTRHVLRLIRDILFFEPSYPGTSLKAGLDFVNKILKRCALIFLISDFLDQGYEKAFKRTGKRHDLVAVHLSDPREASFPAVGLVELEDAETGRQLLIDTSAPGFQEDLEEKSQARLTALRRLVRSARVDLVEISTAGNHLDALTHFFHLRERMRRVRG